MKGGGEFETIAESFYNQGVFTPRASGGRSEEFYNIDIGLKYNIEFNGSSLVFRADIFNVFDWDGVTEQDEVADEESGVASATCVLHKCLQRGRGVRMGVTYDFGL